MNALIETLGNETWAHIIQALLHTLWMGGVVTVGLFIVLRGTVRPEVRYRWCVAAMTLIFLGGLVVWGVLQERGTREGAINLQSASSMSAPRQSGNSVIHTPGVLSLLSTSAEQPMQSAFGLRSWTPWLALAWIFGITLMLVRSVIGVAMAEKIRRSGRPMVDPTVLRMLEETRTRLGIVRRIRMVVTDQLTSPAVMGVLIPTLLIPMTLVTSMSLHQLQFVFLHELGHVRRGDYLANLCQLLVESLLFFNPAIWWISQQMRQEREACCDAIAIELTGGRIEYAETLTQVAENMISGIPQSVPAFGERKTSSLTDRVKRILVPGYRPGMGLTWRALFGSLLVGGILLVLSAVGARFTVSVAAALLTPAQRIELIEQKMVDRGTRLEADPDPEELIEVRGTIRTEDGSPLPQRLNANFVVFREYSSAFHSASEKGDGVYSYQVARGDLYFSASHKDFAPAVVGPLDTRKTTEMPQLTLVLKRGFSVSFRVSDARSQEPLDGALLKCQFWYPNNVSASNFESRPTTTDAKGVATLDHCAEFPLKVRAEIPGYEYLDLTFETLEPDSPLEIRMQKTQPVGGVVLDGQTGNPIPGASVYVLGFAHQPAQKSLFNNLNPWNLGSPLGRTDNEGRFTLASLPSFGRYSLLIDAPGYTQGILHDVQVGQEHLKTSLAPEEVVTGTITGDLASLSSNWKGPYIGARVGYRDASGDNSSSHSIQLPVEIQEGVGHFTFTNKFGRAVTLHADAQVFDHPGNGNGKWNIELAEKRPLQTREVILRFLHPSGVPPTGTIYVTTPDPTSGSLMRKEVEIVNGEVRVAAKVGYFNYEPARTVGYWFKGEPLVDIPDGSEPFIIEVPLIPAGAIFATAHEADGRPAKDVYFSLIETKKSPSLTNQWVRVDMREGIASPLPLGGTYQIRASRGYYVSLSEPILLTEQAPDREIQLRFTPGVDIKGELLTPKGKPIPGSLVKVDWEHASSGFGHQAVATDAEGRFHIKNTNPNVGKYRLTFRSAGMKTVIMSVDFSKLPMSVRMEPGLKLSGKVVEKKSGLPIPNAPVRIYGLHGNGPTEETMTDAKGEFFFDMLHETAYGIHVTGAHFDGNQPNEYNPGSKDPVQLEMVLPKWSELKVAEP